MTTPATRMEPRSPPDSRVAALFVGRISHRLPQGQASGIYKSRVRGAIRIEAAGLVGDEQADRRVHGGPDKAVHHYPAQHYPVLAASYPQCTSALVAGALGENLSAIGLDESNVHIGDRFRVGDCVLQVSQPRSPCWKIDHKFGVEGLAAAIHARRLCGWYYRVLQPGPVAAGATIEHLDREDGSVSLREFIDTTLQHRPDPAALAALRRMRGLAADWARRLEQRARWLRERG